MAEDGLYLPEDVGGVSRAKRAHYPYLAASGVLDTRARVPWLENRQLFIRIA